MKKRFGKAKKFIAMLMVSITLSSSVFYSYSIPAQATTVVPAAQTLIEALMTLFGYSLGFGKSTNGMSTTLTPEVFSSAIDSAFNGGAVQIGSYGSVDFSDELSTFEFLKRAYNITTATLANEAYDKILSSYDYISYKTSGVSSTKSMNSLLGDIVAKYESNGTSALKEDMLQAFTVVNGGSSSGDDDNNFTPDSWRFIASVLAAFAITGALPLDINVPENSEYSEYAQEDLVLSEDGFISWNIIDGMYTAAFSFVQADGDYCDYIVRSISPFFGYESTTPPLFFIYAPFECSYVKYINGEYINEGVIKSSSSLGVFSPTDTLLTNTLPIFETKEQGSLWISDSSTEGFTNLISTEAVSVFYESTPSCTIPEYIVNFMTRTPTTQDVTGLAGALTELSTDTAGTAEYIPAVENVVLAATDALPETATNPEEAPEESVEQVQDPETGNFNYFNILQLILNAIKAIAESVWAFFENPIAGITTGINNLIELVPNCFELVRGWIEALPGSVFQFFEAPLIALQEGLAALNPFESWWPRLQPYLDRFLALFQSAVPEPDTADPDIPTEDEGGNGRHSFDILNLLNGLWLLIMILIMLLSIFLHLMIFIINIFKIPASTGYLNEEMVMGLNYIKTLEIAGIGLSVYDFMMGLVYILMVFGVVKVLRHNIDRIKIPKAMRGGLFS